MKKKMMLSLAAMLLLFSVGCGKAEEDSAQLPTAVKISEDEPGDGQSGEDSSDGGSSAENASP